MKDRLDQLAPKEMKDRKECKEFRALSAQQVLRELPVLRDQEVGKDRLAL